MNQMVNVVAHETIMRRPMGSAQSPVIVNQKSVLTEREWEIARLAHEPDKRIAFILDVSIETVRSHFRHIRAKTGLANRTLIGILADRAERGAA